MVQSVNPAQVPHHQNPIPAAAVHRGLLISSAIFGKDLSTNRYPDSRAQQIALAFEHMQTVLNAGGATLQDVIKLDLYFADVADRSLANEHWLRLFPDEAHRPARHAHTSPMPDGCCLQIVVMAAVPD